MNVLWGLALTPMVMSVRFGLVGDVHMDLEYLPGTETVCPGVEVGLTCCRKPGRGSAGIYGSWTCDTPIVTLESMVQYLKGENLDFVIQLGDFVGHHLIQPRAESTIRSGLSLLAELNIPIASVIGNHDSRPEDTWPPVGVTKLDWASIFNQSFFKLADPNIWWSKTIYGVHLIGINSLLYEKYNVFGKTLVSQRKFQEQFVESELSKCQSLGIEAWLISHKPAFTSEDDYGFSSWIKTLVKRFYPKTLTRLWSGHVHDPGVVKVGEAGYLRPGSIMPQFHNPTFLICDHVVMTKAIPATNCTQVVGNIVLANTCQTKTNLSWAKTGWIDFQTYTDLFVWANKSRSAGFSYSDFVQAGGNRKP